jgi:hypothetical protein
LKCREHSKAAPNRSRNGPKRSQLPIFFGRKRLLQFAQANENKKNTNGGGGHGSGEEQRELCAGGNLFTSTFCRALAAHSVNHTRVEVIQASAEVLGEYLSGVGQRKLGKHSQARLNKSTGGFSAKATLVPARRFCVGVQNGSKSFPHGVPPL